MTRLRASAATTACELKFTFDAIRVGLNSRPSPTLSFPCWIVGEGRRYPRLPSLRHHRPEQPREIHTQRVNRRGEKADTSIRSTIGSGPSSSSRAAAIFAAAGEV